MANVSKIVDLKQFVPSKSSKTSEWVEYWALLKRRYGKTIASGVFAKTWKVCRGSGADVAEVRKATGLPLDNEGIIDTLSSVKSSGLGVLDSIGTGYKIALGVTGILIVVLVGGVIIRVITASAKDLGTAAGVAAKVYTGKP